MKKIKFTVNGKTVFAQFEENKTTAALIKKMPCTIKFRDLFSREKCHNYLLPLPNDNAPMRSYEVGEIAYWPPMHSLVIFYVQNGEQINLQSIGKLENGLENFSLPGTIKATFELAD